MTPTPLDRLLMMAFWIASREGLLHEEERDEDLVGAGGDGP